MTLCDMLEDTAAVADELVVSETLALELADVVAETTTDRVDVKDVDTETLALVDSDIVIDAVTEPLTVVDREEVPDADTEPLTLVEGDEPVDAETDTLILVD